MNMEWQKCFEQMHFEAKQCLHEKTFLWKSVLDWLLGWLCENALSIQNDNTSGFLLSMK